MGLLIGWTGRIAFWLLFVGIVADAVITLWGTGQVGWAILALVLCPLTFFLWPILTGTWWLLLGALIAYWASTLIGRLPPVE